VTVTPGGTQLAGSMRTAQTPLVTSPLSVTEPTVEAAPGELDGAPTAEATHLAPPDPTGPPAQVRHLPTGPRPSSWCQGLTSHSSCDTRLQVLHIRQPDRRWGRGDACPGSRRRCRRGVDVRRSQGDRFFSVCTIRPRAAPPVTDVAFGDPAPTHGQV